MTTPAAAAYYLHEHQQRTQGRKWAVFNPSNKHEQELPIIYGFNNGGRPGWFSAQLIAEDGTTLGGHLCSDEGYMESDLGILEGSRPDRHEDFQKHYPDGYRMIFVSSSEIRNHSGLQTAFRINAAKEKETK